MNQSVNWSDITAPLDVMSIPVPDTALHRWAVWERQPGGVLLRAELANEQPVTVRLDVVATDILRFRLFPPGKEGQSPDRPSDILADDVEQWPPPDFEAGKQDDCLVITTDRLRVEIQRFPWQMRVFARGEAAPFFSQRYDDRAYGYAYEVPPPGFDRDEQGRLTARETVATTPGERFYGFGEKFTPLNKWGQEIVSWAMDSGNVSSQRAYKNIPFFMSSAGYGLFLHTSFPIVYRMGSESSISYSIHVADNRLDYFLIHGPALKDILRRYTDLTGRAPLPPKWSFGFWISRCGYQNQAETEAVVREMRKRSFPCDVISLDPWWMGEAPWSTYEWDRDRFPDPAGMMADFRRQGIRTCLWVHPYVPVGTPAFEEGAAEGIFVRRPDGQLSPALEAFSGTELAALDFTNSRAVAWFEQKLTALLELGAAVFKSDFGEQAPVEAVYHDGRSGLEMHNLYPLLYNRTVFKLTERYFGRGLTWGRSGYAGSQRYPVQWGGDSYSSLDQIAGQLRGLLSYGLSGVPFCSHDVGGFDYSPQAFDYETQRGYPKDGVTYVRWLQFGVFSSHLRAHGKQPREPWTYGPQVEAIARRWLNLRYRLLPYIYSQAAQASRSGLPMVKPLVLDYPDDPNTHYLDWQYLFGDDFLVAPVLSPAHRVNVYLPPGDWLDFWTKERQTGGQWLDIESPLETMPLWVRAGAIIPQGPEMAWVDEKPTDPLTLELYQPGERGETIIVDEDRPDVTVHYFLQASQLAVQIDGAAGQIELIIYGLPVSEACRGNESLPLETVPRGQAVRLVATGRDRVTFQLSEAQ